jgi:LmeA-like phospholipid-binding
VRDLRRGSLDINKVVAHLSGVDVPFSDVVRQHVDRVVVQHAKAEIDLNYADVNRMLAGKHLRLSKATGDRVHVTTTAGGAAHVNGDFPMTIAGSAVVISLPAGESVQIPLPDLPFGIHLQSARAEDGGIVVRCSATGFVIRP